MFTGLMRPPDNRRHTMKPFIRRVLSLPACAAFAAVLFSVCFSGAVSHSYEEKKIVLLLNSYHKGYVWTDEITRAVEDVLSGKGIELHVEYMDTKRQYGEDYKRLLSQVLSIKHRNHPHDLVIVSDDNAFTFIKESGKDIFGDTPVVFCGVNNLNKQDFEGLSGFTGIRGITDFEHNITLIRHLHPDLERILVITDNTTTGEIVRNHFIASFNDSPAGKDVEIRLIHNVTMEELGEKLQAANERSVVLIVNFFRDRKGKFVNHEDITKFICEHSAAPVYGIAKSHLGHGIIGGYLTDGYQQGADAAGKALEILSGTPVSRIPVQWTAPQKLHFDYRQLKKHHIPISSLPEERIIINQPVTFYSRNKTLVINTALLVLILLLTVLSLFYLLLRSRKAERALTRSEKKYRVLFETSNDAIVIFDTDKENSFIDCNPSAMKLFAIPSKDEFLKLSLGDLSPEYQPSGINSLQLTRSTTDRIISEGSLFFEWTCRGKDDREFPVSVVATHMELGGKKIIQAAVRDITGRKAAEQALKESEEYLKQIISVANDGIWEWNVKTGETVFNDRYFTMAGYDPGDFPGVYEEWRKRVHPDDIERVEKAQQKHLEGTGSPYNAEYRFRRKDGTWMWLLSRGKIVTLDKSGKPIRFMGTHSDITELKQTERALRRAQKMEAVGQLTGGIAHDFNNILAIIIGNLNLIEVEIKTDEKNQKRISAAHKAALRAADLTRQLLGFSSRKAENAAVTDINFLIKNMESIINRSVTPEVAIEFLFEENLWLTEIDPGDFEDALLNLVLNARDVMPNGGRLEIRTLNSVMDHASCAGVSGASPGEYVQLSVSDSGEGIDSEDMERIFDPFFTTKPQGKGTGLGLAMVFGFTNRSGGFIRASSRRGKGTTFDIYMPRVKGEAVHPDSKQAPADKTRLRGYETILVVDDELELCNLARITLESQGYRVLTAQNGTEALAVLAEERAIALLFSDVLMPGGINGFELAKEAVSRYPDIRILLTSGYSEDASAENSNGIHSNHILKKPYSQPEMSEKIRELLDKNGGSVLNKQKRVKNYPRTDIEWSEGFGTGIDVIDRDHKKILDLLNRCRRSAMPGGDKEIETVLDKLREYTEYHFRREEMIMEACGFPMLRNHRQVHQLLTRETKRIAYRFKQGELDIIELTDFLKDWLLDHIQIMDRAIVPYCKEKTDLIEDALAKADISRRDNG